MNYISAENLTKSYGIKTLFENISFNVNLGDKIAMVAKNGSGKSTLLKIIMGQEIPDSGNLFINKDIKVILFDQETIFDAQMSVENFIMNQNSAPVLALKNYHNALKSNDETLLEQAINEMEHQKAWDLENEMKQFLFQLKITELSTPMGQLSGGQIKRVALAKLLMEMRTEHQHTLLIMDEPTNHLDVEMVEWLENYLNKAKITLLLVTHDRYFLDAVCDIIWEFDQKNLYIHHGSYTTYLENKTIREENLNATIDKANNLYRKELEWIRRQPKARTTKSKSRIDAFYETEKIAKTNTKKQNLELNFNSQRLGKKIIELKNIDKKFQNKIILDNFSYQFQRGEKIGIVGENGVGKSTFLNIIQNIEPADSGTIETGETIKFGYFSQKGMEFNPEEKVIEHLSEISENFQLANGKTISAGQFLKLFLFDEQTQHTPISKLSGGEKRRLHLIKILYENPNFLIFDEPTNDLDLPTLSILENFLLNFSGCVVIVSHDRYFMDRIVGHILAFEGNGKIKNFTGNFSEYREFKKNQNLPPQNEKNQNSEKTNEKINENKPKKLSYKEKLELEEIEKKLPKLEAERDEILKNLNNESNYELISELSEKLKKISTEIEEKEMRWLELNSF